MIISVPVWGDWHRSIFRNLSYPSYRGQMRPGDRLVVHGEPVPGVDAEYLPLPELKSWKGAEYARAARAHRQILQRAAGEPVVFIPPDNIVSDGAFDAIRRRLDEGADLIAACSIRAHQSAPRPKSFASRNLIRWALQHPHDITRRSIWGSRVATACPSINLFRTDWGAVARCFHLHPIAMRAPRAEFKSTIDDDLMASFAPSKIHVVTDSDELAIVEISPDAKTVGEQDRPLTLDDLERFRRRKCNPTHEFFFEHRICLKAREFHET